MKLIPIVEELPMQQRNVTLFREMNAEQCDDLVDDKCEQHSGR